MKNVDFYIYSIGLFLEAIIGLIVVVVQLQNENDELKVQVEALIEQKILEADLDKGK